MPVAPLSSALPLIRGGQLRAYIVTGTGRSAAAPEIPHAAEAGMPALAPLALWFALWGPRALPVAEVVRLNTAVQRAAATPEVTRRLAELGSAPVPGEDAGSFGRFITAEHARGMSILRATNFQPGKVRRLGPVSA